MRYVMSRQGIGQMMKRHPGIHRVLHQSAQKTLRIAQGRATVLTGNNRSSGRVEDRGVQPVKRGESRMTVSVVFYAPYAMDQEMKTGFLSGSLGQRGPR